MPAELRVRLLKHSGVMRQKSGLAISRLSGGKWIAAAQTLVATRPTAVSLPNAVHIVMSGLDRAVTLEEAQKGVINRAEQFIHSSQHAVENIAQFGARHIRDGDTLLTHCNSEAALGCIIEAHRSGKGD